MATDGLTLGDSVPVFSRSVTGPLHLGQRRPSGRKCRSSRRWGAEVFTFQPLWRAWGADVGEERVIFWQVSPF